MLNKAHIESIAFVFIALDVLPLGRVLQEHFVYQILRRNPTDCTTESSCISNCRNHLEKKKKQKSNKNYSTNIRCVLVKRKET